jgi:tRNA pseudouridine38-40 synthase
LDTWSKLEVRSIRNAINAFLPEEIAVRRVVDVGPSFHSSHSAISKRYAYFLAVGETRPVLATGRLAWERRAQLDLASMRAAAQQVLGRHDFSAFAASGRSTVSDVRTLQAIHINPMRGGMSMLFQGDGFLYKMVRNLVGGLIEVGRGKRAPNWMGEVLAGRNRCAGAATAPPEGLYLWRVIYPEFLFQKKTPIN